VAEASAAVVVAAEVAAGEAAVAVAADAGKGLSAYGKIQRYGNEIKT